MSTWIDPLVNNVIFELWKDISIKNYPVFKKKKKSFLICVIYHLYYPLCLRKKFVRSLLRRVKKVTSSSVEFVSVFSQLLANEPCWSIPFKLSVICQNLIYLDRTTQKIKFRPGIVKRPASNASNFISNFNAILTVSMCSTFISWVSWLPWSL